MAMPRPSGKAQLIAEKVIPGLRKEKRSRGGSLSSDQMSEVEIKETYNIENRRGLKPNEKTRL